MSKTFKSGVSDRRLSINEAQIGFALSLGDPQTNESLATQFATSDAPAVCLAILESAFPVTNPRFLVVEKAIGALETATGWFMADSAAQDDRLQLQQEALKLCDAARAANGCVKIGNFGLLKETEKKTWLSVARAARELNGPEEPAVFKEGGE